MDKYYLPVNGKVKDETPFRQKWALSLITETPYCPQKHPQRLNTVGI